MCDWLSALREYTSETVCVRLRARVCAALLTFSLHAVIDSDTEKERGSER